MEALPQSTQREITLESLALVRARRPQVQVFNELLVQYFFEGNLRQVVPDNMVREADRPLISQTSYILEEEQVIPLMTFEYVSPASYRKDYRDSFRKYERELKIPYYVLFYPERQDLRVHHNTGEAYERLAANDHGRYPIPELELELGLLDRWVRYWFRGELLPLPAEYQAQLDRVQELAAIAEQRASNAEQRASQADAEIAQLKALLERLQAEKQ